MTELEEAVLEWIRCEYAFRIGPHAYRGDTQEWLLKAEQRLRRVATGKGDLEKACERAKCSKN